MAYKWKIYINVLTPKDFVCIVRMLSIFICLPDNMVNTFDTSLLILFVVISFKCLMWKQDKNFQIFPPAIFIETDFSAPHQLLLSHNIN